MNIKGNCVIPRANGYVIWQGASQIDDKPIVAIATGFLQASTNVKTGPMIQIWILRADITPSLAVKTGEDWSICGDCSLRQNSKGKRTCYVSVFQAPTNVWRAFKAGRYPPAPARSLFRGAIVRIGAYGDPAMVPVAVWRDVCVSAVSWTGYTHQWRKCDPAYGEFLMASVESVDAKNEAQAMGWRTYRVGAEQMRNESDEITCPATQYIGVFRKTTCNRCGLCKGTSTSAKNITTVIHGVLAANFEEV